MTIAEFEACRKQDLSGLLLALWFDAKGDWSRAHGIAQDVESREGALVHAYLHRREGDEANAGYWYRQARRPEAKGDLRTEWEAIVMEFLQTQRR